MALDGMMGVTHIRPRAARKDFLHVAIFLADGRVLDDRMFRLSGFSGQESVSNPFEFQLQLHANTSEHHGERIGFGDIVGRPVTFAVRRYRADEDTTPFLVEKVEAFEAALSRDAARDYSLFNGLATGFSMAEPGVYNLSVKAALWKLNLANRYHIYSQVNLRDAIAQVLDRHKIAYDMRALEGNDNLAVGRVQDWMQAGESDFAFLQRLMSKAHLYYYFVHGPTRHTAVFANVPSYREVFTDGRRLRYTHTSAEELGLNEDDVITQYSYEQTLTSSAVAGLFTRQEAAWEEDSIAHFTSYQATRPGAEHPLPFHQYKIYQYGCDESEVARYTDATASTVAGAGTQLSGGSRCDRFRTGYRFIMGGPMGTECHPNPVRPSLEGRRFVITQVQHQASLDGSYQNTFQATEDTDLITPFSIQDTHQGSMLAKVVAVHDDGPHSTRWEYAYKTDFEPAQQACEDRASGEVLNAKGVYVRYATADGMSEPVFVKLAPHMQTVPELNVTVLVSRANDESELPEIQSIIHSNGSKVIMPSGWTANTQVGSNFSTSYGDSKSVRFGRCSDVSAGDVDAAVQKIEDQYKTGQYKDVSYSRGGGYSFSTSEAGRGGMLSTSESHGNTYSHQYAAETKNWSDVDYSYSKSVVGNTENHSTVRQDSRSYQTVAGLSYNESTIGTSESKNTIDGKSTSETVIGGDSVNRSTMRGKNDSYTTVLGRSYSETVMAATENHNTTNGTSDNYQTNNGDTYAESTTNGNSTNVSTVTGISVSRSTSAVQEQYSKVGSSKSDSNTGSSDNKNIVGVSQSINVTGVSQNLNVLGVGQDLSVTGEHERLSVSGRSIDLSLTGGSMSVSLAGVGIDISLKGAVFEHKNALFDLNMPTTMKMVL